jgi:dsDNA-specific endonuclease/ATPase MutS2
VELTNRLKDLRAQLAEEENRVYYAMCCTIYAHWEVVQAAVCAAAELDVLAAKARLGAQLGGVIPQVGSRHMVLLIRHALRWLSCITCRWIVMTV